MPALQSACSMRRSNSIYVPPVVAFETQDACAPNSWRWGTHCGEARDLDLDVLLAPQLKFHRRRRVPVVTSWLASQILDRSPPFESRRHSERMGPTTFSTANRTLRRSRPAPGPA